MVRVGWSSACSPSPPSLPNRISLGSTFSLLDLLLVSLQNAVREPAPVSVSSTSRTTSNSLAFPKQSKPSPDSRSRMSSPKRHQFVRADVPQSVVEAVTHPHRQKSAVHSTSLGGQVPSCKSLSSSRSFRRRTKGSKLVTSWSGSNTKVSNMASPTQSGIVVAKLSFRTAWMLALIALSCSALSQAAKSSLGYWI